MSETASPAEPTGTALTDVSPPGVPVVPPVAVPGGPASTGVPTSTPAPTSPGVTTIVKEVSTPAPTTQPGTQGAAPPADGTKPTDAPAPLDIKLPDGVKADSQLLEGFKAIAQEAGIKGEQAQKIADLYVKANQAAAEQANTARTQQVQTWVDSLAKDKEYGGAKWDQSQAIAKQAVAKFGSPELKAFLNESGVGNHPELVRFVVRIGRAMGEDSLAGIHASPGAPTDKEQALRVMYPSMYPKDT